MSAVALPRNLVPPAVLRGDDRVKSSSVKISPLTQTPLTLLLLATASFLTFRHAKSFINPQRTYLSFNIKKTGTEADSRLVDGIP